MMPECTMLEVGRVRVLDSAFPAVPQLNTRRVSKRSPTSKLCSAAQDEKLQANMATKEMGMQYGQLLQEFKKPAPDLATCGTLLAKLKVDPRLYFS